MGQNNFIPDTNSELYKNYKVKVFRMVPKNSKLICQNILNGDVTIKESGFRIILPWYRSKLVNITKTVIDYPKEQYLTKDQIYVEIDPALTVRITDPIKFEFKNSNPLQELCILVKDVIRSFIAGKDSSELIGINYSIGEKDSTGLFNEFETRTGLHISHLFFKNVRLPKELEDDYEKAKTQELENKRAIAEANSKKEQTRINAEAKKIAADAEAYRQAVILKEKISALKESGYDDKTVTEVIQALLLSESNANIFTGLGKNNTSDQTMAMLISALGKTTGNSNNGRSRTRKKESTTE